MLSNCIKSLKMGYCEEQKKRKKPDIRLKSELSYIPGYSMVRLWTDFHYFHNYLHNDELSSRFHMRISRYRVNATHVLGLYLN